MSHTWVTYPLCGAGETRHLGWEPHHRAVRSVSQVKWEQFTKDRRWDKCWENTILATTVHIGSPSHGLEHLKSLDLPLYFHFNTLNAQWRAECKTGPQVDWQENTLENQSGKAPLSPSSSPRTAEDEKQGSRYGQWMNSLLLRHFLYFSSSPRSVSGQGNPCFQN